MNTSAPILQTAAAVLCLTDRTSPPLHEALAQLGPEPAIKSLCARLQQGDKQSRARNMALILQRLAMDLDDWSIR